MTNECAVAGCARVAIGRGLCRSHYDRQRRTGSPVLLREVPLPTCLAYGCEREATGRNARYCAVHAAKAATGVFFDAEVQIRDNPDRLVGGGDGEESGAGDPALLCERSRRA